MPSDAVLNDIPPLIGPRFIIGGKQWPSVHLLRGNAIIRGRESNGSRDITVRVDWIE